MDTLTEPQFITQDSKGSRYYYKAFKNPQKSKNHYDFVSVVVDDNGVSVLETNYNASYAKLNNMIKKYELLYFKE